MDYNSNSHLTGNAQALRKHMTKEERHLWFDFLKKLPVVINRQKTIGKYIVDFYCHKAKLVVELDGSQHYSETGKGQDETRDRYLKSIGLTVVRYTNNEVNQKFESVCQDIWNRIFASEQEP